MSIRDGRDTPEGRLMELLGGRWVAAAVSAAADLCLADHLIDGPKSTDELARVAGCHGPSLQRLLAVLAGEGIVEHDPAGTWELTEMGAGLRSGRLRELAVMVGSDYGWRCWTELADAIRTGSVAFERSFGRPAFEHLDANPRDEAIYHSAVDAFTRLEVAALASCWDFAGATSIVDVGGGHGTLLIEILRSQPHLRGIHFDRPTVVERARPLFSEAGLEERCDFVGGDFFDAVPQGADIYVVRHIVHNWPDDEAITLLKKCVQALKPGGVVLVIEGLVLPPNHRDLTRLLDLEMLAFYGHARERSKPEMRRLFRAAGLRLESAERLAGASRLLVGRVAS